MAGESILDFGRVDVLAAGDDHVLDPVDEEQIALVIEVAGIARVIPPSGECLGGHLGLVPVLEHEIAASGADLSRLANADLLAIQVLDREHDTWNGDSRSTQARATVAMILR